MKAKLKSLTMGLAMAAALLPCLCDAQTVITGPNISGTWSPSGNPYIVAADCTVPGGQSLIIQPGTVVQIASGMSITGNGMISAVGTPAQRITFQAPISSQTWNKIAVKGTAGANQFKYCDFSNADIALDFYNASQNEVMYCTFQNARHAVVFRDNSVNKAMYCSFQNVTNGIWMTVYANYWMQLTTILNCSFSNCFSLSIYGEAGGPAAYGWAQDSYLNTIIKNCSFYGGGNGCVFKKLDGPFYSDSFWGTWIGYGYINPIISANIFSNLSGTAMMFQVGSRPAASAPVLINNTICNCAGGVNVRSPWDAKVQSSLFVGCTNAVTRSGSTSPTVSYNGFYGNAANFTGYPSPYGMVILANRNGTPSDVLYNIFTDPLFVATNDFHLQTNSPAIDAGTPDWNYSDMCFTNGVSQGNSFPDLGAYGGPDAANWLSTVPILPAQASITKTAGGIIQVSWGAIPRSEYQVLWTSNAPSALTTNWFNVNNGWVRATDKPVSVDVAINPPYTERYYRVQSLGRTPGY